MKPTLSTMTMTSLIFKYLLIFDLQYCVVQRAFIFHQIKTMEKSAYSIDFVCARQLYITSLEGERVEKEV